MNRRVYLFISHFSILMDNTIRIKLVVSISTFSTILKILHLSPHHWYNRVSKRNKNQVKAGADVINRF